MGNHKLEFIDLFAGLGGFHLALRSLGHKCVFSSEIDPRLRDTYMQNFSMRPKGDLRQIPATHIPKHDILCAGFPCQPFSKAGEQAGTRCRLWGDLFSRHVLRVLRHHKPTFFVMENVANLERHDDGTTWERMLHQLRDKCGYSVDARILSPHRFGIPQIRERLFIVGSRIGLEHFEWPAESKTTPSIHSVLDHYPEDAKQLPHQVSHCLEVWQEFLKSAPQSLKLPSFPIWAMEFGASYPYTKYASLHDIPLRILRSHRGCFGQSLNHRTRRQILEHVPSHARSAEGSFPTWKQQFIRHNRQFFAQNKRWIRPWLPKIRQFPPSLQKLEWNCQGEKRNIWKYLIQFRASGVRVKRPTTAPALVAMTTTQVPIVGWERRYMTPLECSRLQSLDRLRHLPMTKGHVHKALGNAVNVEVVKRVCKALCQQRTRTAHRIVA